MILPVNSGNINAGNNDTTGNTFLISLNGSGSSDPNGDVMADLADQEIIKTITLNHHEIETTRYHLPFLDDRDQFKIVD